MAEQVLQTLPALPGNPARVEVNVGEHESGAGEVYTMLVTRRFALPSHEAEIARQQLAHELSACKASYVGGDLRSRIREAQGSLSRVEQALAQQRATLADAEGRAGSALTIGNPDTSAEAEATTARERIRLLEKQQQQWQAVLEDAAAKDANTWTARWAARRNELLAEARTKAMAARVALEKALAASPEFRAFVSAAAAELMLVPPRLGANAFTRPSPPPLDQSAEAGKLELAAK